MKLLNSIFLLVATITLCNIDYTKADTSKEVYDIGRYIMGSYRDTDTTSRVFVSGMSNNQIAIEQEAEANRERERVRLANQATQDKGKTYEVIGEYWVWGQCVPYAQSQGMQTNNYGWARNYPVQQEPTGFVSTYEGWAGHVAVVEKDLGNYLQIRDAGYHYGYITRRIIPKSLVKGYII